MTRACWVLGLFIGLSQVGLRSLQALSLRSALKLEPKIPRLVGQNTRVKEKGKGLSTHAWTLFILKIVMSVMTMERIKKETLVHF